MWRLCGIRKVAPAAQAKPFSNPNELNNLFTSNCWQIYCNQFGPSPGVFELIAGWAAVSINKFFCKSKSLRPMLRIRIGGKGMRKRFSSTVVCLGVLLLLAVCGAAQETTGGLQGTVKDPSGAVVPNAKIVVTASTLVGEK